MSTVQKFEVKNYVLRKQFVDWGLRLYIFVFFRLYDTHSICSSGPRGTLVGSTRWGVSGLLGESGGPETRRQDYTTTSTGFEV